MNKFYDKYSAVMLITLVNIIFLTLFALGCAKKESGEIKIGVINSLTGSAAPYGENAQNGMQLAVDDINKNGGISGKRIKLVVEDDKTDPQIAVAAFRKLLTPA